MSLWPNADMTERNCTHDKSRLIVGVFSIGILGIWYFVLGVWFGSMAYTSIFNMLIWDIDIIRDLIFSRSVAGGKGGRPTAASLPSRDRHSVFTQRKQNMPLLWLRIPLHDIGGARMWMSCLPRCSLKCQASWGERGLRAGSAYLPSSPLHLIVAAKNAWQRLERGEEYRQLVESGCFGKISTFRMCGVKRGGGWARGNNWEEYFSAWPT